YRAMFHLAEEEQELPQAGVARPTASPPPAPRPQRPPAEAPKPAPAPEAGHEAVPPVSPAAPPAPGGPAPDFAGLVQQLRLAGRSLKSPATDAALLAMARGKFRGIMARRLEDLSAEQVIELTRALSSL